MVLAVASNPGGVLVGKAASFNGRNVGCRIPGVVPVPLLPFVREIEGNAFVDDEVSVTYGNVALPGDEVDIDLASGGRLAIGILESLGEGTVGSEGGFLVPVVGLGNDAAILEGRKDLFAFGRRIGDENERRKGGRDE